MGPGAVLLPEGFPREIKKLASRAKIPMGRLGHPDDVAAAVRFFATCPDITGQSLRRRQEPLQSDVVSSARKCG